VADSLADSLGVVRVLAVAAADSTLRALADVDAERGFELELRAGDWWVRAFRDADRNRGWERESERASELVRVRIEPAGTTEVQLVLRREPGGP